MFRILDELSELIYVVDLQTYDLLYVNQAGKELFHIEDSDTGKCYEIFYGRNTPCDFCTNRFLSEDSFYTWEKTNPVVNRRFLLKDKMIDWNGKKARVEIAFDMTDLEARKQSIHESLKLQNLVTECAKRLYEADENPLAIQDMLQIIGEYLHAKRVCIFEILGDNMTNPFEWCAQDVKPLWADSQHILLFIKRWEQSLQTQCPIIIAQIEEIKECCPDEYSFFKSRGVQSLIAVPLLFHNKLIGFIEVDNLSVQMKEIAATFLQGISYFAASMLRHQHTMVQLEKMSYYDSLTGIKNRNAYVQALKKKYQSPVGVVYLDINGMKQINNRLGHNNGDQVLCHTAQVISTIFSNADCYRVGGDEFLVISERIKRGKFNQNVQLLKNHFLFHADYEVSMGINWSKEFDHVRDVIFKADEAMFEDKKAFYRGRALSGRYRCQTDDILKITEPETLHKMIEAGHFDVYYQPQIDIKTERIIGAEALVRYQDASGRFYSPNQFIPILEESRLISILDFYVFERVCSQLQKWKLEGIQVVPVSTNFSRHTLSVMGFADRLQKTCHHYHIAKQLLEIEITETVEADNRRLFYHVIEQLRQKNFRISIDDFGVNNANLSLLTDVDFHVLKIDRYVIETLHNNQKSKMLVSALIKICHQIGIKVVAEGVETQKQLQILQQMDCDVAQGYLFSMPIPTNEFRAQFLLSLSSTS